MSQFAPPSRGATVSGADKPAEAGAPSGGAAVASARAEVVGCAVIDGWCRQIIAERVDALDGR